MTYDLILVPQGAEAAAVRRGVRLAHANTPILAIAMGPEATTQRLREALDRGSLQAALQGRQRVLVLGVAGSLAPQLQVGDVVVYQAVVDPAGADQAVVQDPAVVYSAGVEAVLERLPQARAVTALNSDRLISLAQDKQALHQQTAAEAVDMEAVAIAQTLGAAIPGLNLTTVRVISDDAERDLPNLENTQRADGRLDGWAMAIAMVRQPLAALRLIRGSLRALQVLEQATCALLSPNLPTPKLAQKKAPNRSDVGDSQGSRRS